MSAREPHPADVLIARIEQLLSADPERGLEVRPGEARTWFLEIAFPIVAIGVMVAIAWAAVGP